VKLVVANLVVSKGDASEAFGDLMTLIVAAAAEGERGLPDGLCKVWIKEQLTCEGRDPTTGNIFQDTNPR
jgi:hypothetical protein